MNQLHHPISLVCVKNVVLLVIRLTQGFGLVQNLVSSLDRWINYLSERVTIKWMIELSMDLNNYSEKQTDKEILVNCTFWVIYVLEHTKSGVRFCLSRKSVIGRHFYSKPSKKSQQAKIPMWKYLMEIIKKSVTICHDFQEFCKNQHCNYETVFHGSFSIHNKPLLSSNPFESFYSSPLAKHFSSIL